MIWRVPRLPHLWATLGLMLAGPLVAAFQSSPASGVLAGRVVDGITGQPVVGAVVRLGRAAPIPGQVAGPPVPLPPHSVQTNEQGQFVFAGLAPGRYNAFSDLSGYLTGRYGQQRIDGPWRPVTLGDGQRLIDLTIRIWRSGVITGVVRDEAGEPVIEVRVRALRRMFVAGQPRFVSSVGDTTDDRGVYRLTRLVPGDYIVTVPSTLTAIPKASADPLLAAYRSGTSSTELIAEYGASPSASSLVVGNWLLQRRSSSPIPSQPPTEDSVVVYPTTFHPTAMGPGEATVVGVRPGEERPAIDVQIRPVETFRVSGVVTGGDGRPMRAGLRLVPAGAREFDTDGEFATATTGADAAGRFTFLGVPPGQYVVTFQRIPEGRFVSDGINQIDYGGGTGFEGGRMAPPPVAAPLAWADSPVTVTDRHLDGVSVAVRDGSHLRGTIEFRGGAKPAPALLQRISLTLTRADGRPAPRQSPSTQVDEAGRFMTSQYLPGRYLVTASSLPPGWMLRSAVAGGRDAVQAPLELMGEDVNDVTVTFTTGRPGLSGTVRRSPGTSSENTVYVFPADVKAWIANGMPSTLARAVAVGRETSFEVTGLLPGAYLAIAVDAAVDVNLQNPSSVIALERAATTVTLGEDGASTVSLAVTPPSP